MTVPKIVRLTLTLALLVGVWKYDHWTTALLLSLLVLTNERIICALIRERKYRKERQNTEYTLFKRTKKIASDLANLSKYIYGTRSTNKSVQTRQQKARAKNVHNEPDRDR